MKSTTAKRRRPRARYWITMAQERRIRRELRDLQIESEFRKLTVEEHERMAEILHVLAVRSTWA